MPKEEESELFNFIRLLSMFNNLVNIGQLFIILFTHVNFEIKSYLSIFIVFSFFEKGFNYIYCYKYLILLLLIANL